MGAALATATGGSAATPGSRCARHFPPVIRDGFPEPPMRFSHGGRLETTLRASLSPVTIDGHRYRTMNYEGVYPSPTLVLCPGDRLSVHLINDLPEDTNLHVHGLHVSPGGSSDNVFLDIRPGAAFTYRYHLPLSHPPGAYWYHPHLHMHVETQIFAGMAGAIVVEGGLDDLLPHVPQRLMVLTNTQLTPDGETVPAPQSTDRDAPIFVNGTLNPTVKIHPGQIQRWRIFNASADRIVVLRLQGQRLGVLAQDGNSLASMRPTRDLMIAPGSRREILVRGGARGSYGMKVLAFTQRPTTVLPDQPLLTVRSSGAPAHDRMPAGPLSHPVDLRGQPVDRRRRIEFTQVPTTGDGPPGFLLNDKMFDPGRVDVAMKLGSLEEWTLVNSTAEWHTFHIHVNPFQVISVGGRPMRFVDYQDNISLAPRSSSVIRMRPLDFTGTFVIHCHVTFHEDRGMMAVVQVLKHPSRAQRAASAVRNAHLSIRSSSYGSAVVPPEATAAFRLFCRLLAL
jgi:FtsP/CotA-like multicopper oxidase with cupredoxin domain